MAEIVSLPDLKAHLNVTGTSSDDELIDFLDSATELVREEAQVFDVDTYTETLRADWDGTVVLSHTPVVSVTSVSASGETITGTTFNAYGRLSGVRGWRSVTVTYTAGTPVPSARVATAIKMVAARLWETQRGNGPSPVQEQETFTPGMQGILREVRALLGGDSLGVVA